MVSKFSSRKSKNEISESSLYEILRNEIISGKIRPNERLIEEDLAASHHVSRTPIREALQRLNENGLIFRKKSGWVVREHSISEIIEIFEVRAALEGFAARLAAERATEEELAAIERIHLDYVEEISKADIDSQIVHNDVFHDLVIKAARNQRLAYQVKSNSQYHFVHRMSFLLDKEDIGISISGHQNLVDSLLARDPDRAEKAAVQGVLAGLEKTLARLSILEVDGKR